MFPPQFQKTHKTVIIVLIVYINEHRRQYFKELVEKKGLEPLTYRAAPVFYTSRQYWQNFPNPIKTSIALTNLSYFPEYLKELSV
jgi:hypothetical protein